MPRTSPDFADPVLSAAVNPDEVVVRVPSHQTRTSERFATFSGKPKRSPVPIAISVETTAVSTETCVTVLNALGEVVAAAFGPVVVQTSV